MAPSFTASERGSFSARAVADLGIDLLEVDVGDPVGELADDVDVVSVAVGDVSGVQAQIHKLWVGVGQEALDPLLGVDMGVDMRVEGQLDTELIEHHPAELVGAGDQVLPLFRIDVP